VWALSGLHLHSHYWRCFVGNTRVTATQVCWRSVISSFIQSGFILQEIFLHSYLTFLSARFLFPSRSKSSLWTPNYQAYQDFENKWKYNCQSFVWQLNYESGVNSKARYLKRFKVHLFSYNNSSFALRQLAFHKGDKQRLPIFNILSAHCAKEFIMMSYNYYILSLIVLIFMWKTEEASHCAWRLFAG
jgi:hypothetical protein